MEIHSAAEEQQQLFSLVSSSLSEPTSLRRKNQFGFVHRLGKDTLDVLDTVGGIVDFIGQIALESLNLIKSPFKFRFSELVVQLEATGYRAIGIVTLVTFLIGTVVAYLTGEQLQQYGANIFIVDGIAFGMTRELSPLLVAIIVAGRSGSAFTAQIGTMKLNDELDAMTTLGLSPLRVLVLPRIVALMICMPLLVFLGNLAGITGGLVAADLSLGVTAATFIERLQTVLTVKNSCHRSNESSRICIFHSGQLRVIWVCK